LGASQDNQQDKNLHNKMNKTDKKYYKDFPKSGLIFYCAVIVVGAVLVLYLLKFGKSRREQYKNLEVTGVVDSAVIIRDFIGAKRKLFYEYEFVVKQDTFNGFLQYSPSNGPITIGDSVLIKYLPENPDEINKIILNKDYRITVIK
jgi:hypothetical protein